MEARASYTGKTHQNNSYIAICRVLRGSLLSRYRSLGSRAGLLQYDNSGNWCRRA